MKYFKYGKFRFCDFWSAWFGIVISFGINLVALLLNSPWYTTLPLFLLIVWLLWGIWDSFQEKFSVQGDQIFRKKGSRREAILLPPQTIAVIAYAEIPTRGIRSYWLKNRYSISLMSPIALDDIQNAFSPSVRYYSNIGISKKFQHKVRYQFVVDNQSLPNILKEIPMLESIIVPKSICDKLPIAFAPIQLYVDNKH